MSNKQVKNTSPTRERASAPGVRASVTIEAAFAVPLFMFAVLSLIFFIEIQSIRGYIHAAGSDAAKQAAESDKAQHMNFHFSLVLYILK